MDTFTDFLSAVPPAVWGALIALSGVMYADWRNTRRAEQQNSFVASESDKARLLLVRKEVYMAVPTALQEMQTKLLNLSGMIEVDKNRGGVDPAEILSKVSMVSSTETAVMAARLSTDFGAAQVFLTAKVQSFLDAKADAERYAEVKKQAKAERDRAAVEQLKEFESGVPNRERISALEISRKHAADEFNKFHELELEALKLGSKHVQHFLRDARDHVIPLVELGIKLTIRLRWELGQETDEESYMQEMKRGRDAFLRISEDALMLLEQYSASEN